MQIDKAVSFLEDSFLRDILKVPGVTDISFNGKDIYFLCNYYGRKKAAIKVEVNEVKDFIRQLANITEKQFSYQSPYLDVSIGKYRINATHQSIARIKNQETIHFSIRVAGDEESIYDGSGFVTEELQELLELFIEEKKSIVIGGVTGCGKTELQKYLIKKMKPNTRIIIIDNVLELANLHNVDNLDINIWQSDERNKEATMQNLVKNALRCNPDWLIVAESRGAEMIEVLNSAMTGHPIITTIHAFDVDSMPFRMGRMVMMNDKKMDYESVMDDIYHHFRLFIHLKSKAKRGGSIYRFISSVAYFDEKGKRHLLYQNKNDVIKYHPLDKKLLSFFDEENIKKIPEVFLKQ